jgi:hypothetical protein
MSIQGAVPNYGISRIESSSDDSICPDISRRKDIANTWRMWSASRQTQRVTLSNCRAKRASTRHLAKKIAFFAKKTQRDEEALHAAA